MTHQHQRKFSNYLINPKFQLKFSFQFVLGFLVTVFAVQGISIYRMYEFVGQLAEQPEYQIQIQNMLIQMIITTVVSVGLMAATLFFVALRLSHKIAGPAFVIQNAIENMIQEKYDIRPHLRQGDELNDVYEALARLARKHKDEFKKK